MHKLFITTITMVEAIVQKPVTWEVMYFFFSFCMCMA